MLDKKDEVLNETKKRLSEFSEKIVVLVKKSKKEGKALYNVGKLKLEIMGLRHKIDDKFRAIGQRIFELNKTNKITDINIQELCGDIDKLKESIEVKEKEIEVVKAEA